MDYNQLTQLIYFIREYNIEWHRYEQDVYVFIPLYAVKEFNKILGDFIFEEEGIKVTMQYNYVCYEIDSILENLDITTELLFPLNEDSK